jgi:hypothetical protein
MLRADNWRQQIRAELPEDIRSLTDQHRASCRTAVHAAKWA